MTPAMRETTVREKDSNMLVLLLLRQVDEGRWLFRVIASF
jgi:hypothetical protein